MSPNWDENRTRAILRKTTQIVLGKTLTFSLDSLRFSRRRVTYPRPWHPQVLAIKRVPPRELEAAGIAPASRESSPRPLCAFPMTFLPAAIVTPPRLLPQAHRATELSLAEH